MASDRHGAALAAALTASLSFAASMALIRLMAPEIPPLELVLFRNLIGAALTLPFVFKYGERGLRTTNHVFYLGRACLGFIAMGLWFVSVAHLPLNESAALSFTSPLFATIAAIVFLRESVGAARWVCTIVGFFGAMLVLRPGFHAMHWPQLAILLWAAIAGGNTAVVKHLTRTESATAIVTYMALYMLPFSIVAAVPVWITPPAHAWPGIIAVAVCATTANLAVTRAFALWDASAVMGIDFVRLPIAAALAWFMFGETPNLWAWLGGGVIVTATVLSARRSAQSPGQLQTNVGTDA